MYQAGYIEKSCAMYQIFTRLGSFITTQSLMIPALGLLHSPSNINNLYSLKDEMDQFESHHTIATVADLALFLTIISPCITQIFNTIAYQFACTHCDDDCLNAALPLFENDKVNCNQLETIKNEIARRKK